MMKRHIGRIFRLAFTLVMACCLLLPPIAHLAPGDPSSIPVSEVERYAVMVSEDDNHGHSHDDTRSGPRHAGHAHAHNPADHSHDTPTVAHFQTQPLIWAGGRPAAGVSDPDIQNLSFRIERPPRV
jgi:hypothetical protein